MATAFVSELVLSANQIDQLSTLEMRRLLERAVVTIRDMQGQVSDDTNGEWPDPLAYLRSMAAAVERNNPEAVSQALLDAASMIRMLRIIHDEKE
ncbi:hypothetical protein LAC81_37280 (plasmid) [Ensifer adhaerens]|uniref:hypothetical protein n=1 Tax=Ensifer adhaerens TaxID=106592 RepID=UPI001CC0A111|nr:hypothetical protein [Ensifer adhaerens]MBZ7927594.1 hypothetical protein [Ensifer adhaerens]UAX98000.1 hypothetical protein LAC78_38585 [Ensifer adhaerens]UAY05380.1 hypothetical protein LAC80_37295 [Ensifer adhaerens]UAY12758.1 hypothetical protein LAC81_37280 [Ensifer adhaerens]